MGVSEEDGEEHVRSAGKRRCRRRDCISPTRTDDVACGAHVRGCSYTGAAAAFEGVSLLFDHLVLSAPQLSETAVPVLSRLPPSIRILIERDRESSQLCGSGPGAQYPSCD